MSSSACGSSKQTCKNPEDFESKWVFRCVPESDPKDYSYTSGDPIKILKVVKENVIYSSHPDGHVSSWHKHQYHNFGKVRAVTGYDAGQFWLLNKCEQDIKCIKKINEMYNSFGLMFGQSYVDEKSPKESLLTHCKDNKDQSLFYRALGQKSPCEKLVAQVIDMMDSKKNK